MRGASTPEPPEYLTCPITHQIMADPVADKYGNTYERSAIEAWLTRNDTSPITRQPLTRGDLRPNKAVKKLIEKWCTEKGVPTPAGSAAPAAAPADTPRTRWESWKRHHFPGMALPEPPNFTRGQVTLTLDNLNIGDSFDVGIGDGAGAPVSYQGSFEIIRFNYRNSPEDFRCEVMLSDRPDMIIFEYIVPGSRVAESFDRSGWRVEEFSGFLIRFNRRI